MKLITTLSRAAGLGLCVVAFSGTALADPGNGNGGPEGTPPGQEQKAETPAAVPAPAQAPAPQSAQGQENKAEHAAKQAAKKAAPKPAAKPTAPGQATKAEKQAEHKPAKAASQSKGQSANAHHHVIICHRTGSASNPYVVLNIPWTAWVHAHSDSTGSHPDLNGNHDKILKDPAPRPGSKDGFTKADCEEPGQSSTSFDESSQQSRTECPATVTTTERVLVGIKHYTGAVKNGARQFVVISPSEKSAHVKHADEGIYETRTVTRSFSGPSCETVTSVNTSNTTGLASTEAVGGVAGAVSPAPTSGRAAAKNESAGGVLGAIASAPAAVADTATAATLPFTGFPLWIVVLIAIAVLLAGFALRRRPVA